MKPIFSIICVINTETFEEKPEQLFMNAAAGQNEAEVFLYDVVCSKATKNYGEKCAKRYPGRIEYREREAWSLWQCYNEALQCCNGSYINFSRVTASISGTDIGGIEAALKQYGTSVVSLDPFQALDDKLTSQLYFKPRNCVVDLLETPFRLNLVLDSLFIAREALQGLQFEAYCRFDTAELFLIKLYEKVQRYAVIEGHCDIAEFLSRDSYNYEYLYEKDWYTEELKKVYLPFLKENSGSVIRQACILQLIQIKLAGNINDRNKSLLSADERDEFFSAMSEVFQYIDDDVLVQYKWDHRKTLQRSMSMVYLRMKYRTDSIPVHKVKDHGEWAVAYQDTLIEKFENIVIKVLAINQEKEGLVFEGELTNVYFADPGEIKLYLCCKGKRIAAQRSQIYRLTKYFGRTVKKGYMFRAVLPEAVYQNADAHVHFEMEFDGVSSKIRCEFKKIQARLCNNKRSSYWKFGKNILMYNEAKREFLVEQASKGRVFWREALFMAGMLKHSVKWKDWRNTLHILALRGAYWLTLPVYGKRDIWITFDQLFKGGDNGEYFYRYMNESHKEIPTYYIVNKGTKEYKELKAKYNTVLPFGSFKAQLLSLHAKMIFATRVDVKLYCGFLDKNERYIRNLFNAEVVCLQHGLTIQKIAQYQNRLFDNLKYYFCVSPYEVENIRKPIYGYTDSMISLTGAPRYDGLAGAPKRQILITPTWRRNVTAGTNEKGKNHEYSVNFKHTAYFRIYNTLINDERLIACAKKTGYKLIYLLHPILSPQAGDYDTNDFVELRPGVDVNYETILKESSLMVTDYSGVQFDFAYMRRPLVYYHPDELPPQYDEGNLAYDTMGFGPVCKNNDEIVTALCRFMENECRLDEEYRERIEKFFPYNDQQNCRRVYEAAVWFYNNQK